MGDPRLVFTTNMTLSRRVFATAAAITTGMVALAGAGILLCKTATVSRLGDELGSFFAAHVSVTSDDTANRRRQSLTRSGETQAPPANVVEPHVSTGGSSAKQEATHSGDDADEPDGKATASTEGHGSPNREATHNGEPQASTARSSFDQGSQQANGEVDNPCWTSPIGGGDPQERSGGKQEKPPASMDIEGEPQQGTEMEMNAPDAERNIGKPQASTASSGFDRRSQHANGEVDKPESAAAIGSDQQVRAGGKRDEPTASILSSETAWRATSRPRCAIQSTIRSRDPE